MSANKWPTRTGDGVKRRLAIGRERRAEQGARIRAYKKRRAEILAELKRDPLPEILRTSSDDEL